MMDYKKLYRKLMYDNTLLITRTTRISTKNLRLGNIPCSQPFFGQPDYKFPLLLFS